MERSKRARQFTLKPLYSADRWVGYYSKVEDATLQALPRARLVFISTAMTKIARQHHEAAVRVMAPVNIASASSHSKVFVITQKYFVKTERSLPRCLRRFAVRKISDLEKLDCENISVLDPKSVGLKRFQLSLNQRGFTGGVFSDSYVDAAFGKG